MTKQNLLRSTVFLLTFLLFLTASAQMYGKQYDNLSKVQELENSKGDYNPYATKFIVTGTVDNSTQQNFAYLLETDVTGNVTWNTLLGDDNEDFWGTSVKTTSNGKYIVVGKTTKYQTYAGVYNDSCQLTTPYYNAFVAFIDPVAPVNNWYKILGDENFT